MSGASNTDGPDGPYIKCSHLFINRNNSFSSPTAFVYNSQYPGSPMAIYLVPGIQMVYRFPSPTIRSLHIFRWIRTFGHCLQSQALSNNCDVGTIPHFSCVFLTGYLLLELYNQDFESNLSMSAKVSVDPGRKHLFIRIFLFAGVFPCAYIARAGVPVLGH